MISNNNGDIPNSTLDALDRLEWGEGHNVNSNNAVTNILVPHYQRDFVLCWCCQYRKVAERWIPSHFVHLSLNEFELLVEA